MTTPQEAARKALIEWAEPFLNGLSFNEPQLQQAGWAKRRAPDVADSILAALQADPDAARAVVALLGGEASWDAWVEAGFLDAYLNIRGVEDEAEAAQMLRKDIARLQGNPLAAPQDDREAEGLHPGVFEAEQLLNEEIDRQEEAAERLRTAIRFFLTFDTWATIKARSILHDALREKP